MKKILRFMEEKTETPYTPKPWVAKGKKVIKSDGFAIRQESPRAAAPEAWESITAKQVADAYLISAAPDLFEACELILNQGGLSPEALERIHQACAKAKGENTGKEVE